MPHGLERFLDSIPPPFFLALVVALAACLVRVRPKAFLYVYCVFAFAVFCLWQNAVDISERGPWYLLYCIVILCISAGWTGWHIGARVLEIMRRRRLKRLLDH